MRLPKMQTVRSLIQPRVEEYQMKKSTLIAPFIIAIAAALSPWLRMPNRFVHIQRSGYGLGT
jgi:hypothetical protein